MPRRRSSRVARRSASSSGRPASRRAWSARIRPTCSPSAATSGRTGSSTASGPTRSRTSGRDSRRRTPTSSPTCDAATTCSPRPFGAIGVSAMMHGYLAFDADDELLVPFRTWRNTSTGPAAAELSEQFGVNIPLRWSIAHLHQAILDEEPHVPQVAFVTTLAGYVHWRLTGRKAIGVGDASGMFPIDSATGDYDARLIGVFDGLVADRAPGLRVAELLPEVLPAGRQAGELTAEGAALLDPSGALRPGAALCPPEGDAGTGMVATCSVAPRTGNVSAGTSIFAMVVLERPLAHAHHELDLVTTPAGDPVAMVHCNNGASELAAWVGVFAQFAAATGALGRHRCRVRGALPRGARGRSGCRRPARLQPPRGRADRRPRRGPAAGRPHARQSAHPRELHARAAVRRVRHAGARHARARRRGRRARPDVRPRRHLPHRRRRPAAASPARSTHRSRSARPRPRAAPGASRCSRRTSPPPTSSTSAPTSSERVFADAAIDTVDPVADGRRRVRRLPRPLSGRPGRRGRRRRSAVTERTPDPPNLAPRRPA